MGKSRWVIIMLFLISVAVVFIALIPKTPPILDFPSDTDVLNVSVEVFGSDQGGPIAAFSMPREYVSRILRAFGPAKSYKGPYRPPPILLARVRIQCKDGRVLDIDVPWAWKGPLLFEVSGTLYMRQGAYEPVCVMGTQPGEQVSVSENLTLVAIFREIGNQQTKAGNRQRVEFFFEELERSAGLRAKRPGPPDF